MVNNLPFLGFMSDPSQDMASTECVVALEAMLLFQAPESTRLCFSPCAPVSGRHGPADVAPRAPRAVLALWLGGGCGSSFGGGNFHLPVFGRCMPTFPAGAVLQDLEVSRLLFSSSFPSILLSHTSHSLSPGLAPVHPASPSLASPCCSPKPGRRACRHGAPQSFPTR